MHSVNEKYIADVAVAVTVTKVRQLHCRCWNSGNHNKKVLTKLGSAVNVHSDKYQDGWTRNGSSRF